MLRSRVVLFLLLAVATSGLLEPARATDVSGTITTTTWTKANSPCRVTSTITVPAGNTLTIEPGVDVLCDSAVSFVVNGTLLAVGTPQDSIRFLKSGESYWGGITLAANGNTLAFARISGASGRAVRISNGSAGIDNSVISGNTGGGRYMGGGVYNYHGFVTLEGCTISDNSGSSGSAVFNWEATTWMHDCIIYGNSTSYAVVENQNAEIRMNRCTVYNNGGSVCAVRTRNDATSGMGSTIPTLRIEGTIVWGTTSTQQLIVTSGLVSVRNSDIQQGSGVFPGTGNINADPLFVDPANGDFRLSAGSPCIGMGAPASRLNRAPVWNSTTDTTVIEGQAIQFTVSASDPDGQALVYSASDLPPGATFDPSSRTFSWTPNGGWVVPPATQRETTIVFSVSDGVATANDTVRITVFPPQWTFAVFPNAPNPFNPSTTIRFTLPEAGQVTLAVYDIRGALVRDLVGRPLMAGAHSVVWDGYDAVGRPVASGVYFYRLTAAQGVVTRRMVLVR